MTELKRRGGLDIEQDIGFQRREWIAERFGWALMAAVVAAACAGLFGRSPLSHRTAGDPASGLEVTYDRFAHWRSEADIEVEAAPAADGKVRLSIDEGYLREMKVENVTPEPETAQSFPDRTTFVFAAGDAGDAPRLIRFHVEPERPGVKKARFSLEGGPSASFEQFVYP